MSAGVAMLKRHVSRGAGGAEFDPERWLEHDEREAPDPKSFLNFGAGPRFCPGRNLAFLEAKTALAMIARNFEIELDDAHGPVKESFGFTMVPRGLRVRLRERANDAPTPRGEPAGASAATDGCPVMAGGDRDLLDSQGAVACGG
jgi:hypothetical protein